jgi:hypothetical protein
VSTDGETEGVEGMERSSASALEETRSARTHGNMARRRLVHCGHVQDAWLPLRTSTEQQAGAGVGQLNCVFGLHPG